MCRSVNTEHSLLAGSRVPVATRLSSGRFFGQALRTMDLGPCFEQLRVQELRVHVKVEVVVLDSRP